MNDKIAAIELQKIARQLKGDERWFDAGFSKRLADGQQSTNDKILQAFLKRYKQQNAKGNVEKLHEALDGRWDAAKMAGRIVELPWMGGEGIDLGRFLKGVDIDPSSTGNTLANAVAQLVNRNYFKLPVNYHHSQDFWGNLFRDTAMELLR